MSWSITQSALPDVSAFVLSNKNFFAVVAALIVNEAAVDKPPPGVGVLTAIEAVPADATNAAGTLAVNCVALKKVVVIAVPFHKIDEVFMKLLPFTVKTKVDAPVATLLGEILVRVGAGFVPV